jgi:hypothetical protein
MSFRLPTFGSGESQSILTKALLPFNLKKKSKPDRDAVGVATIFDFPLGASYGSGRLLNFGYTGMVCCRFYALHFFI